jgi:hypothetical protein
MRLMSPLLALFAHPQDAPRLSVPDWNSVLRAGHSQRLLARLGYRLEQQGVAGACPKTVWEAMEGARYFPHFVQRQVEREVRALLKALAPLQTEVILLKGAAYQLAACPFAEGRISADLDILVRREQLADVEERLLAKGWGAKPLDTYDQGYYRRWMHEIPPLRHGDRDIEVDVHHSLLPLTSRLHPNPNLLWEDSIPLKIPGLRILSPSDMLLHTAAHLFQDGEIKGGVKDLLDILGQVETFSRVDGFFAHLLERGRRLELGRPLYYALRYAHLLLDAPIPPQVLREARALGPAVPIAALMDLLVTRVLDPHYPVRREPVVSQWMLYVRSHWLRMPPGLLTGHLGRKAWRHLGGGIGDR